MKPKLNRKPTVTCGERIESLRVYQQERLKTKLSLSISADRREDSFRLIDEIFGEFARETFHELEEFSKEHEQSKKPARTKPVQTTMPFNRENDR